MKTIGKVCFFGFVMVAPALGQSRLQSAPSPAVTGPAYNVSVGYTYLSMPIPGAGRANFNGLDFSGNIGLSPRWGATLDSSYLYTSDVLSTRAPRLCVEPSHRSSVLSGCARKYPRVRSRSGRCGSGRRRSTNNEIRGLSWLVVAAVLRVWGRSRAPGFGQISPPRDRRLPAHRLL